MRPIQAPRATTPARTALPLRPAAAPGEAVGVLLWLPEPVALGMLPLGMRVASGTLWVLLESEPEVELGLELELPLVGVGAEVVPEEEPEEVAEEEPEEEPPEPPEPPRVPPWTWVGEPLWGTILARSL